MPRNERQDPAVGERFGKLVAVEPSDNDAKGNIRWVYECDCGDMVMWRASTVRSNLRIQKWCSCPACWRSEAARRAHGNV